MSWPLRIQTQYKRIVSQYVDTFSRITTGMPSRSRSQITSQLFLGGQYDGRGLKMLRKWGISGIVNMRTVTIDPIELLDGFHYLHLPTPDRQAPTMDQLNEGVTFIKNEIANGGKVYIHCLFGQGRGPTMVMAYLIANGMKVKEALQTIHAVRPFAYPSPEQMKRLKKYRKRLKKVS